MADFQNALISRIFSVFWSGFLHRTTPNDFYNGFLHVFLEFSFLSQSEDFAWAIAFVCVMADFQNALISRIFSVFWSGFLNRTTPNDLYNGF